MAVKGIGGVVKMHWQVKDKVTEEMTPCIRVPPKLRGSWPLWEGAGLDHYC